MKNNVKDRRRKKLPEGDTFPYERLDFGRTNDMLWLKNSAIDTSITGIMFTDLKGKIIYANQAAIRMWGYDDSSEYINKFAAKFGQSWDQIADIHNEALSKGAWTGEIGGVRKDGTLNYVYLQANLVRNRQNDPVCLMCSFMDITEKKELIEQMRIKDIAIEKSITGIILTDLEGRITFANDAALSIWGYNGYEKSRYLGNPTSKYAQSWGQAVDILNIVHKEGFWKGEVCTVKKDGSFNIVHLTASLIRGASDEPICAMCSFVDVTEQKRMQEQMRIKDIAIEKSITGIILTDLKGIITFVNDATASIWGYEKSEFLGKYAAKFAQSWDQIVDILNTVHREGFWKGEIGGVRKDGAFITVHLSASLIRDTSDVPVCLMCSFVDVTEQKRLQEQMRIKDIALASSINGMVITDMDGIITYVNDAFYAEWGGNFPDEVIGRHISHFAASKKVAKEINQAVSNSGRWFGELVGKRRDGKRFDALCSMNTISDSEMNAIHVFYAFVNITDRKKAERELKNAYDQLEIRVMERTKELRVLNRDNVREIEERKQAEKLLIEKEKDLIEKSRELEEINMALKVLLTQREKDKENLEIDVFSNVETNIIPYLNKLLNSKKLSLKEREYLLTIESHINEIVSPFMRKLQTTYQKLTPTEIMVANLIRDAKSTKEMAVLLDTSIRAIEFHRKNIRQKLNLANKKVNLRSHLISLT